jgi:hypothetical protein
MDWYSESALGFRQGLRLYVFSTRSVVLDDK